MDKGHLLLGEAKWVQGQVTEKFIRNTLASLHAKGIPDIEIRKNASIKYCIFVPELPNKKIRLEENVFLIDAENIVNALK